MAGRTEEDVLVVDDDDMLRETVAAALADEGYSALEAANGAEALALLEKGARPALILLDLTMHVMDGWTFRERQRGSAELSAIPVVVLSAIDGIQLEAQRLQAASYLAKPVSLELLLATVERFCG